MYAVDAERLRVELAEPLPEEDEPEVAQHDEVDAEAVGPELNSTCETDQTEPEYPGAHPKSSRAQSSRGTLSGAVPARGGKGSGNMEPPDPPTILCVLLKIIFDMLYGGTRLHVNRIALIKRDKEFTHFPWPWDLCCLVQVWSSTCSFQWY